MYVCQYKNSIHTVYIILSILHVNIRQLCIYIYSNRYAYKVHIHCSGHLVYRFPREYLTPIGVHQYWPWRLLFQAACFWLRLGLTAMKARPSCHRSDSAQRGSHIEAGLTMPLERSTPLRINAKEPQLQTHQTALLCWRPHQRHGLTAATSNWQDGQVRVELTQKRTKRKL